MVLMQSAEADFNATDFGTFPAPWCSSRGLCNWSPHINYNFVGIADINYRRQSIGLSCIIDLPATPTLTLYHYSIVCGFPKSKFVCWAEEWSRENFWILHFLSCRKRTNLLKPSTFTPSMEGEGRNCTIISTSDGQNSRVTFQKCANAWEILVWAWEREITSKCMRLTLNARELRAL